MLRFFEIFTFCSDFCNGRLIGWLPGERQAETEPAPDSDLEHEILENLIYVYPRIRPPKKLILLYFVLALLYFAALSLYFAVTTVTCPLSQ
jgi:hypothetical protein